MAYRAVIFDMDGTLLNTLYDLHLSVNEALALHGMPPQTLDHTRASVGNGVGRLVRLSVVPGTSADECAATLDDFHRIYARRSNDHTAPYPGVGSLLSELRERGVPLAVISNKTDAVVRELADIYFPSLFDAAVGEREGIARKPAPDSALVVMGQLGLRPEDVVYVGDSEVDVLTAANAGIDCVCVSWGFRSRGELVAAGATTIVDDTESLAKAILE